LEGLCKAEVACEASTVDKADSVRSTGDNPILADLQTLKGELELQLHLGSMEAKDSWKELTTRFVEFERQVEAQGGKLMDELAGVAENLMVDLQAFHKKIKDK
jgi:hypothetical protein